MKNSSISWKIGCIAGIDIYIHPTFWLLIPLVLFLSLGQGVGIWGALQSVVFILLLFSCVCLHELGHAMAARHFGIPTRDITMLPIGGVARLQRMPDKPLQEFIIAIAGPLVNILIASLLLVFVLFKFSLLGALDHLDASLLYSNIFVQLLIANIFLVVFNLIPAFPMDGGRVLRSLLASSMDYVVATNIAATVGRTLAILFVLSGLNLIWLPLVGSGNFMLILIGIFVFFGAGQEAAMVAARRVLSGYLVKDAMLRPPPALQWVVQAQQAVEFLAFQNIAFVVRDGRAVGIIDLATAQEVMQEQGPETMIGPYARTDFPALQPYTHLDEAWQKMTESQCPIAPVVDRGHVVGVLTMAGIQMAQAHRQTQ